MAAKFIHAIFAIAMMKMCVQGIHGVKKVDGQWSKYGPWSACDKVCGHNGQQRKVRTCTNPEPANGGRDCVGRVRKVKDCNSVNCPEPCSFDGILVQLLNSLNLNISVNNNHLVAAFSQVTEVMADVGSKTSSSELSNDYLIKKIGHFLSGTDNSRRDTHARTFLGVLLARQETCDYKEIAKKLKDEIGYEGFKRLLNVDGKVTLTFVIDISGSMKSVIPEATAIAKKIAGYKHISNVDYILSTFGRNNQDKFIGSVKNFDNIKKFIKALDRLAKRVYYTEKSGDCREPTYSGIIRAITNGRPQRASPMYVFTDAPPTSIFAGHTKNNAIYHAQKNKIPVNFFLSKPFCWYKTREHYRTIAEATGGFVRTFKKESRMKNLERMIKGSLDGSSLVASERVTGKRNGKRNIKIFDKGFYIDDIAQDGTLEVEVQDTAAQLFNPNSIERLPEKVESNSPFWTILRPSKGMWSFKSKVTDIEFRVKSQAKLDITLEWKFMRKQAFIDHPLIGIKAKVKIVVPNLSRLQKDTLSLTADWRLLSHNGDSFIYESNQVLSKESFKIPMRGKTLSGFEFTRESVIIQPKFAVIRSLMDPWFSPVPGKTFTYRALIEYYGKEQSKAFHIRFVANLGTQIEGDEAFKAITLSRGETTFSRKVTAPSKGRILVRIKLKSDDTEINFEDGPFFV